MTVGQIWDLLFNAFIIFVGVGIVWLRFLEPLFSSQEVSVMVMIVVALAAAIARFILGWRRVRRKLLEAEAQIEAANLQFQEGVE